MAVFVAIFLQLTIGVGLREACAQRGKQLAPILRRRGRRGARSEPGRPVGPRSDREQMLRGEDAALLAGSPLRRGALWYWAVLLVANLCEVFGTICLKLSAGLERPALKALGRYNLIGLESLEGPIAEGAMLVGRAGTTPQGHVTAAARRILEGGSIALAHLVDGHQRRGEVITATSPTRGVKTRVRVTSPHFYDPAGERYRD
jgi:hypothetical protein